VILAGQECVGNAQAERLLQYVRKGGTLVLAGNTAQYNDWRERRRANPLLPARREGKGRILYIPELLGADSHGTRTSAAELDPEPGATSQKTQRMSPSQWVLPKNHQEIYQTIVEGLPKGLSITAEAPLTTVMELLTRPKTRETTVHFVNFDRQHPLAPFPVVVRKQFAGRVKSVLCFSPEKDEPASLVFKESSETVAFTAPGTKLYSMVVISQE
jgi:hypothetical protein